MREVVDAASRIAVEAGVTLGGLVEIDVGMGRCGVAPGEPARVLARRIASAPGLEFRGVQAYHGTAQHLPSLAEREQAIAAAAAAVRATLDALARDGLDCPVVCGAGTGSFRLEARQRPVERAAGGLVRVHGHRVRADRQSSDGGLYREFEHSLFVLASVMSVPAAGRAVVDAGLKSFSAEKGLPWVHGRPGVEVVGASDEHGTLRLAPGAAPLALGDRVLLIPGHCDPTVNLHDWYVAVRRGRVEALWPIAARGASS